MSEDSSSQKNKAEWLKQAQEKLALHDVCSERGFLPASDPLVDMPKALLGWQTIAVELPKLLVARRVRQAVADMSIVNGDSLQDAAELERAMLAFSFIAHAYVWGDSPVPQSLPATLSLPWCQIANKLGRPPVLSYPSYALHNWRRIEPKQPIELGNICLIQNFLGGLDEEWFILVHVEIEAKAGPILTSLVVAQQAVASNDATTLGQELQTIEKCLGQIYSGPVWRTDDFD